MPSIKATPPTPSQIAMFGHVAAALRAYMKRSGTTPSDFNAMLGQERGHTGIYQWLSGKGAPGPKFRPLVAKITGIPEAELTARNVTRQRGPVIKPANVALPHPEAQAQLRALLPHATVAPPQKANDVLTFNVQNDGMARIKLDVVLPFETATPLLRMLLDAGVVLGGHVVG